MSPRRRVAVTGLGLVTPLGADSPSTWRSVLGARSGIGPITLFDASAFPVRIGAEVKAFDTARITDRKLRKLANRFQAFGLVAAAEALADADIAPDRGTAERWGCVVGSGMMGVEFGDVAELARRFAPGGILDTSLLFADGRPDPIAFCRSQSTAGLSVCLRAFGIRGPSAVIHTACASGGQAIGMALKLIRRGAADRVLAGGFDSMLNPIGLAGFTLLQALSADNDDPERASRPFDRTRNGFVLGEGAGFLVLEEWEAACRRGARIYAELAGEGSSLSSYRITDSHPSGDGPIQAMRRALSDAEASPEDVDYVNAHGTSTVMNDRSECTALHAVFGARARQMAVSSTKALTGHLIAAAGAVEAALTALAVHEGKLPPAANLRERDPDCDLGFVPEAGAVCAIGAAISNSFGFGGTNSTLVFRSPSEVRSAT